MIFNRVEPCLKGISNSMIHLELVKSVGIFLYGMDVGIDVSGLPTEKFCTETEISFTSLPEMLDSRCASSF